MTKKIPRVQPGETRKILNPIMATTSSHQGTFSDALTRIATSNRHFVNPLTGREIRREAERRRRRAAKAAKAQELG